MEFDYWNELKEPVTITDETGIIIYMNQASMDQFVKYGGKELMGTNMIDCHPEPSKSMVKDMLVNPRHNTYIIVKGDKKTLIHQTPMFKEQVFKGLIEIAIPVENSIPEHIRK